MKILRVNKLCFLYFFCLIALASPSFVWAQGITINGSNLLRFDEGREVDPQKSADFPDNRSNRSFFENQLRLNIAYNNLRMGGRVLHYRPSDVDKRFFGVEDETDLDKRYIEAQIYPLALRVGHFAEVFGYGLALSLFEDREILFDSELDGVRLAYGQGPVSVIALKGLSRARPGFLVSEEGVTGIHGEVSLSSGWSLNSSFVHLDSTDYPEANLPAVGGIATIGPSQISGEFAWKETDLGSKHVSGHAAYFDITTTYHQFTLLFNYKDYRYRGWTPFQNPPLVSREIGPRLLQFREPHVFYPEDDVGFQLELSGYFGDNLYLLTHFNHSSQHAESQEGIPRPTFQERDKPYWEYFASAENTWTSGYGLELEAGLSEEAQTQFWFKKYWLTSEVTAPISEMQEIHLGGEILLVRDRRNDDEFFDKLAFVGWNDGENLSAEVQIQWTDDEELRKKEGALWPSAEIGYSFGEDHHRVIVFGGRERGGLRCSNGFCRRVQPFEGFRLILESSL